MLNGRLRAVGTTDLQRLHHRDPERPPAFLTEVERIVAAARADWLNP